MKKAGGFPNPPLQPPQQAVPVPKMERRGTLYWGRGGRAVLLCLQPHPLLLPTGIHKQAEACPTTPSLWLLGMSRSLCRPVSSAVKSGAWTSMVARFPTDLKCHNAVAKTSTSLEARLPEFKFRSVFLPCELNIPASAFPSVKRVYDGCPLPHGAVLRKDEKRLMRQAADLFRCRNHDSGCILMPDGSPTQSKSHVQSDFDPWTFAQQLAMLLEDEGANCFQKEVSLLPVSTSPNRSPKAAKL